MFSFEDFKQRLEEAQKFIKENAENAKKNERLRDRYAGLLNERLPDKYSGLLSRVDFDLAEELKYANFAVANKGKGITAVIFFDWLSCDRFVKENYGFEKTDFNGFKKSVGDAWKDPMNYATDDEHQVGVFNCELE